MAGFPRTKIEQISMPRLIVGSNWFYGYSHVSRARDAMIRSVVDAKRVADIMEVFLKAGVDAFYGIRPDNPHVAQGIKEAEQRTGLHCIRIGIPTLNIADGPKALSDTAAIMDTYKALGSDILMPHQLTTDALMDDRARAFPGLERYTQMIRERGMVPGLSTHAPQTPIYADESGLDVATYIQIYNGAGFLMQVEIDWIHRIIWEAQKPVITIKPLAAGRLLPLVGLAFSWATLRPKDMVCIGVMTPDEAREIIDLSLMLLERRGPVVELQSTRSKESLKRKKETVTAIGQAV